MNACRYSKKMGQAAPTMMSFQSNLAVLRKENHDAAADTLRQGYVQPVEFTRFVKRHWRLVSTLLEGSPVIFCQKKPLTPGIDSEIKFLGSDISAFLPHIRQAVPLDDDE